MPEKENQKNVRPCESVLDETASIYQKTEPKSERQKWKELKGKEKIQYFLQYYGFLCLGILFGITVVVSLAVHFATKQDVVLGLLAVNADGEEIEATGADYFQNFLKENSVDTRKNTISVNYTMYIDASSSESMDQSSLDAIQTLFMTQSVDLFFSDEKFFAIMAETGYLTDLREYLPQKLLDQYADNIVYVKDTDTGENIAAGIRLADNAWLKKTGWYQGTAVVGLADSISHKKLAVQMIRDILE